MSQHDMTVDTAFGQDVQDSLQALASTSKGGTAPSTPYAGQQWLDDSASPWVLKIYDGAVTLAKLDGTGTSGHVLTSNGIGVAPSYQAAGSGDLLSTNNLSDVANIATSRTNLGLGSLAVKNTINNDDWSGTDLSVANGGTGTSILTDGGILLGSGTGAITATAVLADGEMIVGDGTTDPSIESGATLRASIGVAIGSDVQAHSAVLDATTASFLIADESKLDGIEALADVTDATNIAAAGGLLSGNNLSDVGTAATALSNLGGIGAATTDTLTNKTIDANGTGNAISNIDIGNAIAASQAEAEAGTDNTKLVTPLRVKQAITTLGGGGLTLGTELATTSGTSQTIGSIPAGTKKITVTCASMETNSAGDLELRLGDSGGVEATGYICSCHEFNEASSPEVHASTTGFVINYLDSSQLVIGAFELTLEDSSSNTWICAYQVTMNGGDRTQFGTGSKSLSGELTQISFVGGTFDGGAINISYQ